MPNPNFAHPIAVDLDGTVWSCDVHQIMWNHMKKHQPLAARKISVLKFYHRPLWKCYLWHHVGWLDHLWNFLNYPLLTTLTRWHSQGAHLILATGALEPIAKVVRERYPIFHDIVASTRSVNCIGHRKALKIKEFSANFAYLGNSYWDIPCWRSSTWSGMVNASPQLQRLGRCLLPQPHVFEPQIPGFLPC